MQLPPIRDLARRRPPRPHHYPWHQPWSRRRFAQTATGLTALGAAVGTGLLRPRWLGADSTASFWVEWRGSGPPVTVRNPEQGFVAELVRGTAQTDWTARVGNYEFASAPLPSSTSAFAEFGRERNGIFFR